MNFRDFFTVATGHEPYPYQCRLACGEKRESQTQEDWLTKPDPDGCRSRLINIPTGLGKTAAVVLAWLWNRVAPRIENRKSEIGNGSWPRRLVYCLPMRTLVEQTRDNVALWLRNLRKRAAELGIGGSAVQELDWLCEHCPIILMGGEEADRDWDIWPEKPGILVGTQDMLLSRALNRGYGMSRARWPMHFGLLQTDCLWVFDEIQLMGAGLATTAQLEAFRNKLGRNGCASFWMSATLQGDWLKTVNLPDPSAFPLVNLDEDDFQSREVRERREARKPLQPATSRMDDSTGLAREVLKAHQRAGGRSLVIVNTVKRGRELAHQLRRLTRSAESKPELVLLHSRFRAEDRRRQVNRLLAKPGEHGTIVISTQVVEAGVDVSAITLFTELAPWASMVQRFGRSNRSGKENKEAQVFWIGLPEDDKQHEGFSAPYRTAELLKSRELLERQQDVGPASLPQPVALPYQQGQVLRFKDFIELFDTTPDLAGNDIDVERYVREVEECDVQVFWREWPADQAPSEGMPGPRREELCAVPVGKFSDFLKDAGRRESAYRWDYLDDKWLSVETNRILPGQTYLLRAEVGGYTAESGWDPGSSEAVEVLPPRPLPPQEAYDADQLSQSPWQSVAQHTDQVCRELETILARMGVPEADLLRLAARWHDFGKAHPAFQAKLKPQTASERANQLREEPVAKAPKAAWRNGKLPDDPLKAEGRRKHFRHELASALALLVPETPVPAAGINRDLVAYLVAAHHGKVRLSIRSLPGEYHLGDARRFARGVWDNDRLPRTNLGGGVVGPEMALSLEPMELGLGEHPPFVGLESWAERMLKLRDSPRFGPFRLAYLEALLRAADERASELAKRAPEGDSKASDVAATNSCLEKPSTGSPHAPHVGERAGGRVPQHVDGGRTGEPGLAAGDTRPPGATRYLDTIFGPLTYSDVAERLALRALEVRRGIIAGDYASTPLTEHLVCALHRDLCSHLVPGWAGCWRITEVTVGSHLPPIHFQVPLQMRDYAADLNARWPLLEGADEALLLETLAFAEGRLLCIHPFQDFNGRVTRLFLVELLRRAELPVVRVAVRDEPEKARYFAALQAGDHLDWRPLIAIWRERFAEAAASRTEL